MPGLPGVYLMKDDAGRVIYIGKAKNLRKRVSTYFKQVPENARSFEYDSTNWKTSKLLNKIGELDFILTDNEIEAFLLESNLIKKYRPIFNIELKDQQRYTYLKITDEPFPRLLVVRRNATGDLRGPKGRVYGPFVQGSSKFLTIGLLRKLFKVRICHKLPKKPCLEYFLRNCDAPCINNITKEEYLRNIESLQKILEGRTDITKFMNEMEIEMRQASQHQDFETAQQIRDTLFRLRNLRVGQKMEKATMHYSNEEYVGIVNLVREGIAHVMTLRRRKGVISDMKKFEFELIGDNSLASFLCQYYSSSPDIPQFIYVNEMPESNLVLRESIKRFTDHDVKIILVSDESEEQRDLMNLILRNLWTQIEKGYPAEIVELRELLQLPEVPSVIDCFDVSNLGSSYAVGACTRFVNGKPNKACYRKFKIKLTFSQNDFAMMNEIVTRRYSSAQKSQEIQCPLPDLIVIDGGKGQLGSAISALRKVGLEIPCISIAKENEAVYSQKLVSPILIPRKAQSLKLIQHIRDEAHRFGLAYNRQLRNLRN
jgi:excinuclease ABC subunit C